LSEDSVRVFYINGDVMDGGNAWVATGPAGTGYWRGCTNEFVPALLRYFHVQD